MFPIPINVLQAEKPSVGLIMALGWVFALPPSAGLILPSRKAQPTTLGQLSRLSRI